MIVSMKKGKRSWIFEYPSHFEDICIQIYWRAKTNVIEANLDASIFCTNKDKSVTHIRKKGDKCDTKEFFTIKKS